MMKNIDLRIGDCLEVLKEIEDNSIDSIVTDLMLYLIRLVTPKGGITLDPFMGSGFSGKAAVRGGFQFVGIEREAEYFEIAEVRIEHEQKKPNQIKIFE